MRLQGPIVILMSAFSVDQSSEGMECTSRRSKPREPALLSPIFETVQQYSEGADPRAAGTNFRCTSWIEPRTQCAKDIEA